MSKLKGLRSPIAQIARLAPVAPLEMNGLSTGMLPSAPIRRTLPRRLVRDCAFALAPLSPTVT